MTSNQIVQQAAGQGEGETRAGPVASLAGAWPITILLVLTVLVPVEFGFSLGSLFFTWAKAYLLVASVAVLPLAFTRLQLKLYDWFLIAHALWTFVAYLVDMGVGRGLEAGGTYVLEVMVVYLMMRLCIRSLEQVAAIIWLLFWLVAIATIPAIPEAVLKFRFIHEFAQSVTGHYYFIPYEERRGMLRAASFFEHPILFGVFCAAMLSPMWFTTRGLARYMKAAVIGLGTF